MWNAMARQRNSYLHATLNTKHIDASVLNKCVDLAMARKTNMPNSSHPDFCSKTLPQPNSFGVNIFKKNARIAYGLAGIPKLIREMVSTDMKVQSEALHSLSEELQDPYKCYRAILDFDIVKKLNSTMDSFYPYAPEDPSSLEHLVLLIGIVASHQEGAKQLIHEYQLVSCLYDMVIDDRCISKFAAKALLLMSSQPEVADLMASGDHIQRILNVLQRIEIITEAYEILANLIERAPGKAIDEGCFTYLYPKIKCRDEYQPYIVKCFALLLNSNESQESCDTADALLTLYELYLDESLPLMTREYLSLAIMSALYSTRAMWRCREFWDLPLLLIKNAHNKESAQMQLWCLQALRQLTMMPSMKNFVRRTCKKRIKNISCLHETVEKRKTDLLTWLRKRIYVVPESDNDDEQESEKEEAQIVDEIPREAKFLEENDIDKDGSTVPKIVYRLDYHPVKRHGPMPKKKVKPIDYTKNVPCRITNFTSCRNP